MTHTEQLEHDGIPTRPYPTLERLINERDIRQKDISDALGVTTRTLQNKLAGKTAFTWAEVCLLQKRFFPDVTKDTLMANE